MSKYVKKHNAPLGSLDISRGLILWNNAGMSEERNHFQIHIKIPDQAITDSVVYLKSCFWNQNKTEFKYINSSIIIN